MDKDQIARQLAELMRGRVRVKQGTGVELLLDSGEWVAVAGTSRVVSEQVARYRRTQPIKKTGVAFCFLFHKTDKTYVRGAHKREAEDEPISASSIHHDPKLTAIYKQGNVLKTWKGTPSPTSFEHSKVALLNPVGGGCWVGTEAIAGELQANLESSIERLNERLIPRFFTWVRNNASGSASVNNAVINGVLRFREYPFEVYGTGQDFVLENGTNPPGFIFGFYILDQFGVDPDPPPINYQWTGFNALDNVIETWTYVTELGTTTEVDPNDSRITTLRTQFRYWQLGFDTIARATETRSQSDKINYYLFHNDALTIGEGSSRYSFLLNSSNLNGTNTTFTQSESRIGSGVIPVLPGVTIPWSANYTKSVVSSGLGQTTVERELSTQYNPPTLIDNKARYAVVRRIAKNLDLNTSNLGVTTGSYTLTHRYILVRADGDPVEVMSTPVLSFLTNATPVLAVGTLTFTGGGSTSGAATQDVLISGSVTRPPVYNLVGTAVHITVKSENQIQVGIGQIQSISTDLSTITVEITQASNVEYSKIASIGTTIRSNTGSFDCLKLDLNSQHTNHCWVKNKVYVVNTRTGDLTNKTNFADEWIVNFAADPVTFTKQLKPVEGLQLKVPESLTPFITAGSYFPV